MGDVVVAWLLGLSLACYHYCQAWASPLSRRAGCLAAEEPGEGPAPTAWQHSDAERGLMAGDESQDEF